MLSCPLPHYDSARIELAYGDGGSLMSKLIEDIFLPAFGSDPASLHDSAVLEFPPGRLAFTTDSFVVYPLFFPGGDIGSLAVHGTVNDLAMSGAVPLVISAAFIIEEGLPISTLKTIVDSMGQAARNTGVRIVTGDTKVVEKGKGNGIFISTSGIGHISHDLAIHSSSIREGDVILISGDLGRHGIAVMSQREGLSFGTDLASDSAPLHRSVQALLQSGIQIHCLRDITRGGLATTLHELADASGLTFLLQEELIPIRPDVSSACEMLGLDPLQIACEGRFCAIVPKQDAERTLSLLKRESPDVSPKIIGSVCGRDTAPLLMATFIGSTRIISMPTGTQLPRIC